MSRYYRRSIRACQWTVRSEWSRRERSHCQSYLHDQNGVLLILRTRFPKNILTDSEPSSVKRGFKIDFSPIIDGFDAVVGFVFALEQYGCGKRLLWATTYVEVVIAAQGRKDLCLAFHILDGETSCSQSDCGYDRYEWHLCPFSWSSRWLPKVSILKVEKIFFPSYVSSIFFSLSDIQLGVVGNSTLVSYNSDG